MSSMNNSGACRTYKSTFCSRKRRGGLLDDRPVCGHRDTDTRFAKKRMVDDVVIGRNVRHIRQGDVEKSEKKRENG